MATEYDFKQALAFTLRWEGGDRFTDDPRDPGGATRYGISYRFLENLPLELADVNGDGQVGWEDVRAMELEQATAIYRRCFWDMLHLNEQGQPCLALVLFDTAVNCGGVRAVRWFQEALGVAVDGILGSRSLAAWKRASAREWDIARQVMARRREHYWNLADKTTWGAVYIKGWLNRTFDLGCVAAEWHGRSLAGAVQNYGEAG
ncbi:MAG: glycoside hydrolase family 108 protein [Desulfovibrio sp.]|jgi:lysozyme family protein